MLNQNPYEPMNGSQMRSETAAESWLTGLAKALAFWGGSFVATASMLMYLLHYPKLPSPQPLSFYITLVVVFFIGSILSWGCGWIADSAGPRQSLWAYFTFAVLFVTMAVPGILSLLRFGIGGNAMTKTLVLLVPTIIYTSCRTKRWTRGSSVDSV